MDLEGIWGMFVLLYLEHLFPSTFTLLLAFVGPLEVWAGGTRNMGPPCPPTLAPHTPLGP